MLETFFLRGNEELYSYEEAPALSAMRLVTSKPGGESIQHSDTSNVHACFAQGWVEKLAFRYTSISSKIGAIIERENKRESHR